MYFATPSQKLLAAFAREQLLRSNHNFLTKGLLQGAYLCVLQHPAFFSVSGFCGKRASRRTFYRPQAFSAWPMSAMMSSASSRPTLKRRWPCANSGG